MIHLNFMFVPGSCGDFFVKSLHLNDYILLENSSLNASSVQQKFKAHSYADVSEYSNWAWIDREFKNSGDTHIHVPNTPNSSSYVNVWYMNNHAFSNLNESNILGADDTEVRLLMDCTEMEKFVICNGYKKNNKFEGEYISNYNKVFNSDVNYVNLSKIVKDEESFLDEYNRILALVGIKHPSNETYVLRLYKEWKKTIPAHTKITIEEFMFAV